MDLKQAKKIRRMRRIIAEQTRNMNRAVKRMQPTAAVQAPIFGFSGPKIETKPTLWQRILNQLSSIFITSGNRNSRNF